MIPFDAIPLEWWKSARSIVETASEKIVKSWRGSTEGDDGKGCLIVQLHRKGQWRNSFAKELGFIDDFDHSTPVFFGMNKPELLTIINRKIAALEEFSIPKGESNVDSARMEVHSAEIS